MTDEQKKKRNTVCLALACFLAGVLVSGGFSLGYHFSKCRHYKLELESVTARIDESADEIDRVRTELRDCQDSVKRSIGYVTAINGAAEQIRKQAEILRDYYNRIDSICSSLGSGNNSTDTEAE